jgi:hypothetical protein
MDAFHHPRLSSLVKKNLRDPRISKPPHLGKKAAPSSRKEVPHAKLSQMEATASKWTDDPKNSILSLLGHV